MRILAVLILVVLLRLLLLVVLGKRCWWVLCRRRRIAVWGISLWLIGLGTLLHASAFLLSGMEHNVRGNGHIKINIFVKVDVRRPLASIKNLQGYLAIVLIGLGEFHNSLHAFNNLPFHDSVQW